MSEKNSLSRLFEVVAESFPTIEFKGFKFKVRKLTASLSSLAVVYALEDARSILSSLSDDYKDQLIDDADLQRWIDFKSGDNEGVAESFGMYAIKSKGDLEVCKAAIQSWASYIYVMTLVNEDLSEFNRADLGKLAELIQTTPEFEKMIVDALATYEGVTPNDQQPLVKP